MPAKYLVPRLCEFPGCHLIHNCHGLCKEHSNQRRKGRELTPIYASRRRSGSPPRIICDEAPCPNPKLTGPCHIFRGGKNSDGYGLVRMNGKSIGTHLLCWRREIGDVPTGMEIDHQCHVRSCCNVDHLRAVTHQVNSTENVVGIAWQINAAKTHCPKGHPYDTERSEGDNCRRCRMCRNERRRWRQKRPVVDACNRSGE